VYTYSPKGYVGGKKNKYIQGSVWYFIRSEDTSSTSTCKYHELKELNEVKETKQSKAKQSKAKTTRMSFNRVKI
jgi:hypothetical protein